MSGIGDLGLDRVVKLGGSLLDWPEFSHRLRLWLARQPIKSTGLIVGGGTIVDCLREADRLHHLGEAASHWLSIKAMELTAQMVAQLLPDLVLGELSASRDSSPGKTMLINAEKLVKLDQQISRDPLPASWQVTSDSIAARACTLLGASELVLLKSASAPRHSTLADLAAQGYVDAYFPQAAQHMPLVRVVNLRDKQFAESQFEQTG